MVPDTVLGVVIPAWVEGQDVVVKHALKQANSAARAFEDEPALGRVAGKFREAKFLVKGYGSREILHRPG